MNQTIARKLDTVIGKNKLRHEESLAEHALLKKGGQATLYCELDTQDDLIKIVQEARKLSITVFVLGSGSYIDIPERGIDGLVIKNNCRQFTKLSVRGTLQKDSYGVKEVLLSAESGAIMNQVVRFALDEGLEGIEYQLGLPGTVGGAIVTNAKFKTHYVRQALHSMRILGSDGMIQTYTKDLPYFVTTDTVWEETQDVVLSAVFKLYPGDKKALWERGEEAVKVRNSVIAKP